MSDHDTPAGRRFGAPARAEGERGGTRAPTIHLTLPAHLLALYREHEGPRALPPLSHLCADAMRDRLYDAGVPVPPEPPPPPRTAAATRARIQRRRDRRAEPGT